MVDVNEATPLLPKATQWLSTSVRVRIFTAVASLAEGYDIGVINGAIRPMMDDLNLSIPQLGIAVGIMPICTAVCALLAGSLADWVGRKPTILACTVLLISANLLWAFANGFIAIVVARAVLGAGIGFGITSVTIYMSEVAPAHQRGLYTSFEDMFINVGILLGFAAGVVFVGIPKDWRWMVGIGAIPAALVFISLLSPCFPESPRYLRAVGRLSEARVVLLDLLNGDQEEVNNAFDEWERESTQGADKKGWYHTLVAFCTTHRSMALAGVGIAAVQMLSGVVLITMYSSYILVESRMSSKQAIFSTLLIGVCRTAAILMAFWLLDRWGRRPLFISSTAGCALSTGFIAFVAYMSWSGIWVAVGLACFGVAFSLGLGPATYTYIGEVFDNEFRAKGVAVSLGMSRSVLALAAAYVPSALAAVGIEGVFLIFSITNVFLVMFVSQFCPETKGLTLEQIREIFVKPALDKRISSCDV